MYIYIYIYIIHVYIYQFIHNNAIKITKLQPPSTMYSNCQEREGCNLVI